MPNISIESNAGRPSFNGSSRLPIEDLHPVSWMDVLEAEVLGLILDPRGDPQEQAAALRLMADGMPGRERFVGYSPGARILAELPDTPAGKLASRRACSWLGLP